MAPSAVVINDLLNTLEEEDYNAAIRYIEFLSVSRKQEKAKPRRSTIDAVWPGLKP